MLFRPLANALDVACVVSPVTTVIASVERIDYLLDFRVVFVIVDLFTIVPNFAPLAPQLSRALLHLFLALVDLPFGLLELSLCRLQDFAMGGP